MNSRATGTALSVLRISIASFAVATSTACVNVVDIDAEDSVRFSNFEASVALGGDSATRLRLRGASASGEFDQTLDADERIEFGDTRFAGFAEIEGDLDLSYYSLAIGQDLSASGSSTGDFQTSFYLGVARTNFDLTLASDGERVSDSDHTTEFYLQYGLRQALSDSLALGFEWAVSLTPDLSGMREIDLTLDYRLYRGIFLAGGYRWLDYVYAEDDMASDIRADFRGPFIGLSLAL